MNRACYPMPDAVAPSSLADLLAPDTVTGSNAQHGLDKLAALESPPPLKDLVRVQAVRPSHFGNTGAWLQGQLHNLALLRHGSPAANTAT